MRRPFVSLMLVLTLALAACSTPQLLNVFTPERGYDIATNLPFDTRTGLKLDVYTPERAKNAPVVVFFFGKRWSDGDKSEYKFVGQALASRGVVAVIANYRLYPQVRFPDFVEDGARALKWVRANIDAYGGSPERLFVMGHSAGAHIAALLALNEQYLKDQGGSRHWLKGMIGLAGPYDFLPISAPDLRDLFGPPEQFIRSQPIYYVDGRSPPLLLMHGEDDQVVWVKNSRNLAVAAGRAGAAVTTVIYPEMSHMMMLGSLGLVLRGRSDVLDHIVTFISKYADAQPGERRSAIEATPLPEEFRAAPPSETGP